MNQQSATITRRSPPLVCHLSSVHWADDPRVFHKQCQTLAAAGYEVVLVAVQDGRRPGPEGRAGVRVVSLPRVRRYFPRWFRLCPRLYRLAKAQRAAVYHVHDPELIPWALLLRLRTGAKIVYDMHEYYSEFLAVRVKPRMLSGLVRWASRALEWAPCRFFDAVVFATDALRGEFPTVRHGTTLRNFPHRFPAAEPGSQGEHAPPEYDIVFTGNMSIPRFRFMLTTAQLLAEKHPRFRWLFIGLDDAMIRWARDACDPTFLASHLCLLRRQPFDEVMRLYARCGIGFNYHNWHQRHLAVAIPIKVLEYMGAGLPVVSSALPELTRLLGTDNRHAVLLDSDSPADYAAAISALFENPELAARIGREGRELVRCRLAWQVSEAPKLRELYARLTGGPET